MTAKLEKLLTSQEVADVLSVTPNKVRDLRLKHNLPHMKIGSQYRYSPTAFKRWLERMEK